MHVVLLKSLPHSKLPQSKQRWYKVEVTTEESGNFQPCYSELISIN